MVRVKEHFAGLYSAVRQRNLLEYLRTHTEVPVPPVEERPLAIYDEIGYLPWDRTMAHLFFRIVENRYERASTIYTSNHPYSEWGEVLGDPVLAAAVLDRVRHHSTTVNIRGDSYRLRVRRKAGTPTPVVPMESKERSTASADSPVRERRR